MRRLSHNTLLLTVLALGSLSGTASFAQDDAAAAPAPVAQKNALLATVNGDPIHVADVAIAAQALPAEVRQQMPQDVIFGKLVEQLISRKALVVLARKQGLQNDPEIKQQMEAAADQVLQKSVLPLVNEDAIKAKYDAQYAGKPGEEEVHARHILVDSQAKATDIIAQLKAGAKFEDLAKKYGDPKDSATQQGGDLGYFKKGDMLPEFSDVAFSLKPGEYTQTPVHTRYGWHVIQVLDTRVAPPPTYDAIHDQIRQELIQADVQAVVAKARKAVKIVEYGPDGKPVKLPAPAKK